MTESREERDRQYSIDDGGHEDEFGANDLSILLLEQNSGKLLLRRLFDVPTEAAVRR